MKRILITGASGMLGATLVNMLKSNYKIFATGNSYFKKQHSQYMKFDLKDGFYQDLINWANPDIIIHCGALTDGNICENNPSLAFDVNGVSIYKLLCATKNHVKIIYISTDAVFPSSCHLAKEVDLVSPENVYGKSKELGEFFLNTSVNRKYTIVRTTIVGLNINQNKTSFVEWIINSIKQNKDLGLFSDVLFSPISIWSLAEEIKFLIETNNINCETLHIAGELCTKHEFGVKLLHNLNLSSRKLFKTYISNMKNRAGRSNDQSLDSSHYQKYYNRKLLNLDQTILNIKQHYELN
tara:strand:+ start:513 stop:1400 length:888 start_codon:yes stop_codon:yes gene_type:complete